MATITKADLINRVLIHMEITAQGQSPSAAEAVLVDQKIDEVNESLIGKGLVQWETNAIPDYAVLSMIALVAFWSRPAFGMVQDANEWNLGEIGLRRQVSRQLNGEPVTALFY